MKSLGLLLFGILVIWIGCAGSAKVTQDTYLAHQGFIELSKGNYDMAEANLLVSLEIQPDNPYSLLNLGAVYQETGRTLQAKQLYQKLIELNPDHTAKLSNDEKYNGKSLVEIAKLNLKTMAVNSHAKNSVHGPIDMREPVINVYKKRSLPVNRNSQLTSFKNSEAISASGMQNSTKSGPNAPATGDGPASIGLSAIGASAGAPGIGSADGGPDGGSNGDSSGGGTGDVGDPGIGDGGGGSDGGSGGGGSDGGSDGGGSDGGSGGGGSDGGSDGGDSDGGSDGGGSDGGSDGGHGGGHGGGNNGNHGGHGNGHGGGNSGNHGGHGNGHGGGNSGNRGGGKK
jgi:hypothetical protein